MRSHIHLFSAPPSSALTSSGSEQPHTRLPSTKRSCCCLYYCCYCCCCRRHCSPINHSISDAWKSTSFRHSANESRISQQRENPAGNIDYRIEEASPCDARWVHAARSIYENLPLSLATKTKPKRTRTCIHNSKLALELLKCLLWFLPHGTHIPYHTHTHTHIYLCCALLILYYICYEHDMCGISVGWMRHLANWKYCHWLQPSKKQTETRGK